MNNFKQQLDREMGLDRRFQPAMEQRIMQHITEPQTTKIAWPVIFTSIAATALTILFSLLLMFPETKQSTATPPLASPIESMHVNANPDEKFYVSTSPFSLGTPLVLNDDKLKYMQILLSNAKPADTSIGDEYIDFPYADVIVKYDTGKERALRIYAFDEQHYALYDVTTHETFKGTLPKNTHNLAQMIPSFSWTFVVKIIGILIIAELLLTFVTRKIFAVPKRKERSVASKQRIIIFLISFSTMFYLGFSASQNALVLLVAISLSTLVNTYFEYRYAPEDRQYIEEIVSTIVVVMIAAILFMWYIMQ